VLVVQDIPVFVAQLSTATENNTQAITQSSANVQTIVEILVKVADVSQNIIINKPVMENFLKTVDILVSASTIQTWINLNNDSRTDNASTALLSAIENISSRLTSDNFRINATSIELNRTVTNSTFYSGISSLPNSTTEIQIPEIPVNTPITVIVFTTLDSILPTRDTSSNGSIKSDVRINGDVVVVKVDNKTINNISFAFDITNQSLGNPQCVFWSFNLDAWDSTGCEAKPYKTLTIVAINLVVLIVVLYKILRRGVGAATQPDEKHALVVIARCVAILTPIFGLTWGFGIGTMVSQELGIHVVFALLNSLQGFFILVFGTLLDSKIREALAGRLSLRNLTSSNRTRSTSAGPSSSSGPGFFQRMRRRNVYNVSEASAFSAATSSHNSSGSDTFVNA
ncbi:hypothetical protein cypCar_00048534, partial [Cyprinus carpio]